MEFITIFIVSFVVVYFVLRIGFKIYIKQEQNKLAELMKKVFLEQTPVLYTEVEGNTVFLYNKETNKFQCQAATIEDLAKEYASTENFIAKVLHDNKELWFVEGDVLDEIIIESEIKEV
jgi:hypothetical protein